MTVASAVRTHGSRVTLTDPAGKVSVVSSRSQGGHHFTHVVFINYLSWGDGHWFSTRRASARAAHAEADRANGSPDQRAVVVEVTDAWEPDHNRVMELIEQAILATAKEGATDAVQRHLADALATATTDYENAQETPRA